MEQTQAMVSPGVAPSTRDLTSQTTIAHCPESSTQKGRYLLNKTAKGYTTTSSLLLTCPWQRMMIDASSTAWAHALTVVRVGVVRSVRGGCAADKFHDDQTRPIQGDTSTPE